MSRRRRSSFRQVALIAAVAIGVLGVVAPSVALTLNGNYLRVAVNGGFGLVDSSTQTSIRFDPTGIGTFGDADFFYPGSAFEGWTIKIDGGLYYQTGTSVGISGAVLDTSSGSTRGANYVSNPISSTGIVVTQSLSFDVNGQTIRFDVEIENTSDAARVVKFMRLSDPDQDANVGGEYDTNNDVQSPPLGKLVTAATATSGTVGLGALGLDDAIAFQAVAYEPSVSKNENWFTDPDTALDTPHDPNGMPSDDAIYLAFDLGTIEPSATKSFSYYYVLGSSVADVLAEFDDLDATPPGPAAQVRISSATTDLVPGATRTLIATITDDAGHRIRTDNTSVVTFTQTNALDSGAGSVSGLGMATAAEGRATLTVTGGDTGPVVIGASADGLAAGSGNPIAFDISPTVPLPYALDDGIGWSWGIQQDGEVEGTNSAFDWGFDLTTNSSGFPTFTTAEASIAGRQVELGPQTFTAGDSGFYEATRRVYVSPTNGFVRYLEVFDNPTTVDWDVTAYIRSYTGGEGTATVRTSSGDTTFDTDDTWIAQHDNYYPATAAVVAGNGGAIGTSYAEFYSEYRFEYQYEFDVPAGQRRIIMHFGVQRENVDDAEAAAVAMANLTPSDALAGISEADLGAIINWSVNTTSGPATQIALFGATATMRPEATRALLAIVQDADGLRVVSDNTTPVAFLRVDASGTTTLGTVTAIAGRAQFTMTGGAEGDAQIYASADGLTEGAGNPLAFTVAPVVSLPAVLTDGLAYRWDIQRNGTINDGTNYAFDSAFSHSSGGTGFPDFGLGLESASGRQMEIGAWTNPTGLAVTRRVFVSPTNGFVRYLEIFDNEGDTELTTLHTGHDGFPYLSAFLMSDGGTNWSRTTDAVDWFAVANTNGYPSTAYVYSNAGGLARSHAQTFYHYYGDVSYNVVVPAHSRRIVMRFGVQRTTLIESQIAAMELANLTPADALEGISADDQAAIINFDLTPTSGAPARLSLYAPTSQLYPDAARTLIAAIEDAEGDIVVGDNTTVVTFAQTNSESGSGSVGGLGSVTVTKGIARLTVVGAAEGEVTVEASSDLLVDGDPLPAGAGNPTSFVVSADVDVSNGLSLTDGAGFVWDIQDDGNISDGTEDAFDGGLYLVTDPAGAYDYFPSQTSGVVELAGRQLVLGPATMGGTATPVEVTRRIFVPQSSAFARFLESLYNPNAEPATVTLRIESNLGSDGDETFVETSSGDAIFTTADNWQVTDDAYGPPPNGDPAVAFVVAGDGGNIRPSAASRIDDDVYYDYTLTIPAGATVSVLHFSAQRNSGDEGVTIATELAALSGNALSGLTETQVALIQNFPTSSTTVYALAKVSGDNASALVGSDVAFVARVQNFFGDPVEGVTVAYEVLEGDGSLGAASGVSNADGEVSIALTLGAAAGLNRVEARVGAIAVTFNATGTLFLPSISAISPAVVIAGESDLTLTVTGAQFADGATIRLDGVDAATTVVSETQLSTALPASLMETPKTVAVAVFNPGPSGGLSGSETFSVKHPMLIVTNTGTVDVTVEGIAYDATLYSIYPDAEILLPGGGSRKMAIDFGEITVSSMSDPLRVPIGIENLGTEPLSVSAGSSLFRFFPSEFVVGAGASRSVQALFPSVESLAGTLPTELLNLNLSTSGSTPGSVVVTVGEITQAPLAVGAAEVSPSRIREADLAMGGVDVTVTLEDVAQAESVAAIDLFLSESKVIRKEVTRAVDSNVVSFSLSSEDVGGVYGRYRVFAVPYGAEGTGTPIATSLAVYIAGQPQDAWLSQLTLTANEQSQAIRFGSALNASDANVADEDALMPPYSGGSAPYLVFQLDGASLRRDIRSVPDSGRLVWNVEATVPSGYTGTLAWQYLESSLPYYDNALLEQAGKAYDLRRHQSMTIPAGTHLFQLVIENARPETASGSINIGLGGWTMFSLPGASADASPTALAEDGINTIYGWDGAAQEFTSVRAEDALVPVGAGYVVNRDTSLPSTLEFEWQINTDQPAARIADVTLHTGWNLIGAPSDGVPTAIFGVSADNVIEWLPTGYETVTATSLAPFRSYWVYNPDAARSIVLSQERHQGSMVGNILDGSVPSAPLAVLKPEWSFALNLVASNGVRRTVTLGSNPRAKTGFDNLDAPLPPSFSRDLPEFYATAKDSGVSMRRSIVPVPNRAAEWTLVAYAPEAGAIEWSPVRLPDGYRLRLTVGGAEYDLTREGSVPLAAGRHALTAVYDWQAPASTAALVNFPNPFNPETWIPFELKEDSVVKVTIYDVTGVVVRELDLGFREKGYYRSRSEAAYWDGRNELGEPSASGLYFYEFRTDTYRAVRRMLLAK